ncbi:AAA family ATPase [Hoeflea alexandrii]|uniref:AAA family ATPase n=1 Tax=Hoeflea alexandrii TaxID=288436 RepID=UPI0022AE93A6|nr:AAA family ATPase [Hoeflea alexandrii]MCZ4287865.1 AAA family ATPase [Hoeflea alexandrii]
MNAAAITATPYEWKDPKTLPLRGEPWRIEDEFEDYPDKALAIVKRAVEKWARENPEPLAPANDNNCLSLLNPADLEGQPVPPREWFVQELIPARQVTILNGDGGVGKSLLALQIAAASASASDVCGLSPAPGRALYVGAEDDADEFHRRLADIATAQGRALSDLENLRVVSLADSDALLAIPNKAGNLEPTSLFQSLVASVGAFEPRFVVLDTAADMFGGDEIKRGQVRQFIGMLRALALQADCAILLLAHPSVKGMESGSGTSGSTAWSNSVRSRLYLTSDKDDASRRILKTVKANYGTTGDEIKIQWQSGAFVLDDGKPSIGSALVQARHERIFVEVLQKLTEQGRNLSPSPSAAYAPKLIAADPDAKGISKKDLESAMARLLHAGRIQIETIGPKSRATKRLIVTPSDGDSD